jgi:hypothetical protein
MVTTKATGGIAAAQLQAARWSSSTVQFQGFNVGIVFQPNAGRVMPPERPKIDKLNALRDQQG